MIGAIETAYQKILLHPKISVSRPFRNTITSKLRDTIHVVGYSLLANAVVDKNIRKNAFDLSIEQGMKKALRDHILLTKNKFLAESRNMRKLLRLLCRYGSNKAISVIESVWREVISDYVYEECTKAEYPTLNEHEDLRYEIIPWTGKLVDRLVDILGDVRHVSRVEMAVTEKSSMSGDLGFLMAFKRLPKELSIELTKALVVRISSLIDSNKHQTFENVVWAKSIDNVIDLIQIFFNQTSAEFQHFYELLLARRLLKNRYLSLPLERSILESLPAMSKGGLMIRDIEQTEETMGNFRNYLVHRMDFMSLKLPHWLGQLALTNGAFSINVLTGDVWPSFWISPISYSSLKLPVLDSIKEEFMTYFECQYYCRSDAWSMNEKSHRIYQIHGSEENQSRINGIYEPTIEMSDGWPIYEMRGNPSSILEYSSKTNSWQVKKRSDKGRNAGWAYCKSLTKAAPDALDKPWYVWKKSTKSWIIQPLKVTGITNNTHWPALSIASINESNAMRPRSIRRLIWCHNAGSITLQVNSSVQLPTFLLLSEPQAAVLLAFNNKLCNKAEILMFSLEDLCDQINLPIPETVAVLNTLTNRNQAVLEVSGPYEGNPLIQLSPAFFDGSLQSSSLDHPLVLSSLGTEDPSSSESILMTAGINSLYGWRNELIDACVVRVLKEAYIHKSGEFRDSINYEYTALPIDMLSYRVRKELEKQCTVSTDDVLRRSERLVSIGAIDKVVGNNETFRSIAYCYLSDTEDNLHRNTDLMQISNSLTFLYGQDLFDTIKLILGVKSSSLSASGIDFKEFKSSFLKWIMLSKCSVSPNANGLECIARVMLKFAKGVEQQLNALQFQYLASRQHESQRLPSIDEAIRRFVGIDSLESNLHLYCLRDYIDQPSVHNYLNFNKIYLQHLPVQLMEDITRYFRSLLGEKEMSEQFSRNLQQNDSTGVDSDESTCKAVDIDATEEDARHGFAFEKEVASEAVESKEFRENMLKEIDRLWHRTASVTRDELIEAFGFSDEIIDDDINEKWPQIKSEKSLEVNSTFRENIGARNTFRDALDMSSALEKLNKKQAFASSKRNKLVRMSFQKFVGALLSTASNESIKNLSIFDCISNGLDSNCLAFGMVLEQVYFKRIVDTLSCWFGTDLKYGEDSNVDDDGSGENDSEDEEDGQEEVLPTVYLPCEFCGESVAASLFEAHQIACSAGELGPLNIRGNNSQGAEAMGRHPQSSDTIPTDCIRKRPTFDTPVALDLLEQLLNQVVKFAADLDNSQTREFAPLNVVEVRTDTVSSMLEKCFNFLDSDHDGYLSAHDFLVNESNQTGSPNDLDPFGLYGKPVERESPKRNKEPVNHVESDESFLNEEDELNLNTPIPLTKTDSLWASVSSEKNLPTRDSSWSYSGLEEAEYELSSLVNQARGIINESEGNTIALLIYYKWDVKTLIEDYLENRRIVRLSVGLGPIDKPSFLRYDIFREFSDASSDGLVTCGVCLDSVPGEEAFALNCRHWYCSDCWKGYIDNAVNDRSVNYHCPSPDCKMLVTQEMQQFFCDKFKFLEARSVLIR